MLIVTYIFHAKQCDKVVSNISIDVKKTNVKNCEISRFYLYIDWIHIFLYFISI